jgi:hypothetical protein
MTVNTKEVTGRREVTYGSLEDLKADLDAVEAAHQAGTLDTLGNWSAGEIFDHCGKFMECALDGFPGGPPTIVRWVITLLLKKKALAGGSPPPGFKIPVQAPFLVPDEGVTFEQGMARWRGALARIDGGAKMTHDSPIFGKLTHEQWQTLQCGHATLHMSFLVLG